MKPKPRSDEWFKQRQGRLTASVFGMALGLSPFKSAKILADELRGEKKPFKGNVATQWGEDHEAKAIAQYEQHYGMVYPAYFQEYSEWSGCTVDAYKPPKGIVEIKCPYSKKAHYEIPHHYIPQIQGQLGITKRQYCHYVSWTPDEWTVFRVERDAVYFADMMSELYKFWVSTKTDEIYYPKVDLPEIKTERIL